MTNPEELVNKLRRMAGNLNARGGEIALEAADIIASLTPKPISEAKEGDEILALGNDWGNEEYGQHLIRAVIKNGEAISKKTDQRLVYATHYLPLSALTALMKG